MHDGLQFQIIFHILFAVEGFSAWKGKSLLHSSVAALDEGPEFDQKKYEDICNQFKEPRRYGGVIRVIIRLLVFYTKYKWHRFRFLFMTRLKKAVLTAAMQVHNVLAFVLRNTPLFSLPLLAAAYICQYKCEGNVMSQDLANVVLWFIGIKVFCYIICATINKIAYCSASISANIPSVQDILKSDA